MELDVRPIPRSSKHSTIFDTFTALEVGEHFILLNDHDPLPLRSQFDVNFARSFTWEYVEQGPEEWRVKITKIASTALPQVLVNTNDLAASTDEPDLTGAIWKVPLAQRDLDSNVISLLPDTRISSHAGPDLDIMFIVVSGAGEIVTETDDITIQPGDVVWLPRRALREIVAHSEGLRYLTVHKHKTGLQISSL